MSPPSSRSAPVLSDGEVPSGDEEKAISSHGIRSKDNRVNGSTRLSQPSSRSSQQARNGASAPLDISRDVYAHFRGEDGTVRRPQAERSRSRSPYRKGRDRSRSPYRATKPVSVCGEKRRREDDHYDQKAASDPRRFKVHYQEQSSPRDGVDARPRRSNADLDRPEPPRGVLSYDDGDRRKAPPSKAGQERDRSRSPYRHDKYASGGERRLSVQSSASNGSGGREGRRGSTPSAIDRESTLQAPVSKADTKIKISLSQQQQWRPSSEAQKQTGQTMAASNLASSRNPADVQQPQLKLSEAEIIEQRRKRRETIKAKHKSELPLLKQALEQSMPMASAPSTPAHDSSGNLSEQHSPPSSVDSPGTPRQESPPDSPAAFAVNDDEELANRHQADLVSNDDEGPSAADYDPNMDMQEDRPDHKRQDGEELPTSVQIHGISLEPKAAPAANKELDMFADEDEDDMFAAGYTAAGPIVDAKQAKTLDESLLDNWDYPDGHYRIILGELLDNRYAVQQQIGKGTFATVVRALDTRTDQIVAVKIACANETMTKAGTKEQLFLEKLNEADPEDKKHIIRLERSFEHKGHLCLVFEALSADLREVLKKFGRNVGLNLKAIKIYAQQMFLALSHMKKCEILHADLKPDNILVSEKRSLIKLCDLGTASFAKDAEITPYLVSRFYRAPEVILGVPFDYSIDMWSIGCTLFELYTGRILFAGADNNNMLRTIQECRGKIPMRMLKKSTGTLVERHFDIDGNFFSQDRDKVTGKVVVRQVHFNKAGGTAVGKDLKTRLSVNAKHLAPAEVKEHAQFVDLMDKCLQLDPTRRITANEALRHGFLGAKPINATTETKVKEKVKPAMMVGGLAGRLR